MKLLKYIQAETAVILKLTHSPLWVLDLKNPPNKIYQILKVHSFSGNKQLCLSSQPFPLLK